MISKLVLATLSLMLVAAPVAAVELSPLESLGKNLFFDKSLSNPPGQSCADCHSPETGWTGSDSEVNAAGAAIPGAVHTRAGNRKPPTAAYAGYNPVLHKAGSMGGGMGGNMQDVFVGGMFWDGRASGWVMGDPLAEQAMGPFLNPLEQNNPNAKHVCLNVLRTGYATQFEEVWGAGSLDCVKDVDGTYQRIGRSIAAYERSAEVSAFNSKFDAFWKNSEGKMPPVPMINMTNWTRFKNRGLTDMELQGLMIFNTKGKCSTCHFLQPMNGSRFPLFTDFRYHNLGVPANPENPYYDMPRQWNPKGEKWVDQGLGGFLAKTAGMTASAGASMDYSALADKNMGKQKTPTLRNVDKRPSPEFVKAFGHNGHFKSLQEVVHFYNLRDVLPICDTPNPPKDAMGGATCFPAPEVAENINRTDMGNLGLTPQEGMALIQFLKTLTDL
ncbi:cytochrome-c peroxidase [Citrifermentans bremense]|uniref:cytochrome-c peroxidase n=1 Tax=Citrifermentans bremense TaxID=60035 RepID=UPI0004036AA6|nr:cytochrome c peroxidase [Citrifermentans bremense]